VLFLHQNLLGEKYFPVLQLDAALQVLISLASKPGWLVLFPLVLVEGELRLSYLVGGVGLSHFPTLVLPMAGTQWRLHDWTEGLVVPLRFQLQSYHTFLPASLLVSLLSLVKHCSWRL
jgi:hypothetical protein